MQPGHDHKVRLAFIKHLQQFFRRLYLWCFFIFSCKCWHEYFPYFGRTENLFLV